MKASLTRSGAVQVDVDVVVVQHTQQDAPPVLPPLLVRLEPGGEKKYLILIEKYLNGCSDLQLLNFFLLSASSVFSLLAVSTIWVNICCCSSDSGHRRTWTQPQVTKKHQIYHEAMMMCNGKQLMSSLEHFLEFTVN